MVFVDTAGLARLSSSLGVLGDGLIPHESPDPAGCGLPALVAACAHLDRSRQQAQVRAAGQVDALAVAVGRAARRWEQTESHLGRQ